MRSAALPRLLEQIRALGEGEWSAEGLPRAADRGAVTVGEPMPAGELRRQMGAFLGELAERVEAELSRVLGLGWDQIDSLVLVDAETGREARRVRSAARALEQSDDEATRAEGLAAALTLDAVLGVVSIVERRMAALVRLRGEAPLLVEGRPFVDLGPALAEAARAWT
jgi:hypothetical protein